MGPSHAVRDWVCQRHMYVYGQGGKWGCALCTLKAGMAEVGNESSLELV